MVREYEKIKSVQRHDMEEQVQGKARPGLTIWSHQRKRVSQQKQMQDPRQEDKISRRTNSGRGTPLFKTTGESVVFEWESLKVKNDYKTYEDSKENQPIMRFQAADVSRPKRTASQYHDAENPPSALTKTDRAD